MSDRELKDNKISQKKSRAGKRLTLRSSRNLWQLVKSIDWLAECLKAVLTSFVFLIISTGLFWLITRCSPGEYEGKKLEQYLLKQIADDAGIPYGKGNVVLSERLDGDRNSIMTDRIVLCGNYRSKESENIDGRFVYIFERTAESFWNNLIGTSPRYESVFSAISQEAYYPESTLMCERCFYEDINGDDSPEIVVHYRSNFADRQSNTYMVLQKIEGKWQLVSPEFSGVIAEIEAQVGKECIVLLDSFSFYDPRNDGVEMPIYGQSHHGNICEVENPLWGGYDWLYCIAVNDGTTGLLHSDKSAYVMERLTDHGIFRDPNWNEGKVLYVGDEDIDIQKEIDAQWGYQVEGTVFYGEDIS